MTAWLASLIANILQYITVDLMNVIKGWWANAQRAKAQDTAAQKVADDMNQGKARDDQARKDESDWINS